MVEIVRETHFTLEVIINLTLLNVTLLKISLVIITVGPNIDSSGGNIDAEWKIDSTRTFLY